MISWIQRSFQHHFRLIFAVLLIGMVVPFIFTIGSTPGIGRPDHKAVTKDYFGHNLASQEEIGRIRADGRLSAELQFGASASPEQIEFYAYQRVAALHLADQMHIPAANPAELPDFIKNLRLFAGRDGQFDASRYEEFRKGLKADGGVTEADIARVLLEDVRAQKIEPLLAGPGYVLPGDVAAVIVKGDTSWTLSTATVNYAAYDPEISLSDADISKFFSDNSFRYTVAPRVSVDSIAFPASAYAPQVPLPSDAEVREFYDANPGRFPRPGPARAPGVKADAAADFAAVQPQVRAALLEERARRLAVKAGSDVAYALYEGKVARGPALDAFLAEHKLKASSLAPFTLEAGPAELGGSHEIATAAFELSADRYYSEALPSPDGAVVLIWRESLPTHEPMLAEVRDRVRADALDNEKRKRFVEFGQNLKAGIQRRLKEGESIESAVTESAGRVKVDLKSYPAFTLRSQPHDIDPAAVGMLERLDKGSVSDMETTADKGILVYVADKKVPSVDQSSQRYAQLRAQMARAYSGPEALAILAVMVEGELKKADAMAK